MKNGTFLTIIWIACIVVLGITIGSYIIKFHATEVP
jgi:hypothetical protein